MRKIICSPERLIPQQLEEGTKYFTTYSNPRRGNVGYFGSTLVKDIQRVGLRRFAQEVVDSVEVEAEEKELDQVIRRK